MLTYTYSNESKEQPSLPWTFGKGKIQKRIPKAKSSGYQSSRSTSRDSVKDDSVKSFTPYRLPRLLLDTDELVVKDRGDEEVEKIYGRFGYEYVLRLPELKPLTPSELISPQRLLSQRYRQVSLVPRLRAADVLPEYRHTSSLIRGKTNWDDDAINTFNFGQRSGESERNGTARSNSVQWKLGQVENSIFDITGQTHVQGPFSRGFKVRCKAPPIWMKMKWGRSNTVIV